MSLLRRLRLWQMRRRWDAMRAEFDRATAGMTEAEIEAEVNRIVQEVRAERYVRLTDSATSSEIKVTV